MVCCLSYQRLVTDKIIILLIVLTEIIQELDLVIELALKGKSH